jgi:hypothetical protein
MHDVPVRISKELNFDMAGTFKEALDKDRAIAERGLGLRNSTLKSVLKFRFFAHDTHATTSTTHGGLYDHWRYHAFNITNYMRS